MDITPRFLVDDIITNINKSCYCNVIDYCIYLNYHH
jgi:hypothetical protein